MLEQIEKALKVIGDNSGNMVRANFTVHGNRTRNQALELAEEIAMTIDGEVNEKNAAKTSWCSISNRVIDFTVFFDVSKEEQMEALRRKLAELEGESK